MYLFFFLQGIYQPSPLGTFDTSSPDLTELRLDPDLTSPDAEVNCELIPADMDQISLEIEKER